MKRSAVGSRWRYAFASVAGTYHQRRGKPCEDASTCSVAERPQASMLVAAAADGAGTARYARVGARLACHVLEECTAALLQEGKGIESVDRAFAESVVTRFQFAAECVAHLGRHSTRDLACTLLACFVGDEQAAFLQLGDGAIVIGREDDSDAYDYVFWPEQGEFANETVFATGSGAEDHLRFHVHRGRIAEVALFSDGLQSLVLDYGARKAHEGFFEPMFRSVRRAPVGHATRLSRALAEYLESDEVRRRTNDDKTLVLASRRPHRRALRSVGVRSAPRFEGKGSSE